ncbi:MAG: hypothetical protein HOK41_02905 [Nitrospina sp.]|jgi:hypothetical protein|nr:hypothetical protein [Nitrospina sp.]MBT6717490.1 hypothetical protein [Nitrospina sp.]
MAEEVGNFPLDQGNTGALRGLEQSREEVGRPRRLDDNEEDLRDPQRVREAEAEEANDPSRPERTQDRVEITQDAQDQIEAAERNRSESQTEETQRETLQENEVRQQSVEERSAESEDALQTNRSDTPTNTGDAALSAGQGGSDPEEALNEGFQLGNTQTNPNRTREFSTRNQIDNPQEAAAATNDLDSNPTSRTREARDESRNSGNDVADAPEQQNVQLQQRVESANAEIRGTEEVAVQEDDLSETAANVPERRSEQRAEAAQEAARNEPPLDIPASDVDQIEEVPEPLQEAQDTNPLRAPGPSEIRDEPDATAIETERGQNVSNLI